MNELWDDILNVNAIIRLIDDVKRQHETFNNQFA